MTSNTDYFQKTFKDIDLSSQSVENSTFEDCKFINCSFFEGSLYNCNLDDCEFTGCNISMTKLDNTKIRDTKFTKCKMLGLEWNTLSTELGLKLDCEKCDLTYGSFIDIDIVGSTFIDCRMHEMEMRAADLSECAFTDCDLTKSAISKCRLIKADLSTSKNYVIDPSSNILKGAKFTYPELVGLLVTSEIEIVG